jgi:hypothetical protein
MTTAVAPARLGSASAATWGVALLLPVGPAAIAALRLILPYYTAGDSAETVAAVQADAASQSAVLWLGYVGILCLVPGLFAAARVCRAAAPRLTTWALALAVPGYLSLGMFLGADHLLWSTSEAGLSVADSSAVVSAGHVSIDVSLGAFVIGHVVGTVLLGLALLRSHRIPAWAAWAITLSQPLHFVATVILGSPEVDFVAWSLTALGMALVARALVREPAI